VIVDDFESGLASGTDADGVPIGFNTFSGSGSTAAVATTDAPPAPVPGTAAGNDVLAAELTVTSFAGFIHGFENEAADTWVPQDWSPYEGFTMWLYGLGTGNTLFLDLLENRNPGSTTDDAERWSVDIKDDFSGWKQLEIPFSSLNRKGVGNGAPDDGLELFEVHGWAFGALGTGGPRTYFIDDVGVYGTAPTPPLAVRFASGNFDVAEGETGDITVRLNRSWREGDPDVVTVDFAVGAGTATPGRDYDDSPARTAGTLTFTKASGERQQTLELVTSEDSKYEGDERVILELSNAVGAELTGRPVAAGTIKDDDAYDPLLLDDFERYPHLWDATEGVQLDNPEVAAGDPAAVPGQGRYERVLEASVPIPVTIDVQGRLCNQGKGVIPVALLSTPTFDATTVDHSTVTFGDASEAHTSRGAPTRHVEDVNRDGRNDLVFHFRFYETGLECDAAVTPLRGMTYDGQVVSSTATGPRLGRDFAIGQDWSGADALGFWYHGANSGDEITVEVLDNRAPDPGPGGWDLVWSDEFAGAAGTPPNPANWGYELGDGTVNGIPGWGNSELQYYTDSTDNAALDGDGNLVIKARQADGSLQCYYGPCEYTSARLLSAHRAEFAYGRVEARVQVPDGGAGLWPAFWSLGTDIDRVGWPQTGEIDVMEYVSRVPDEVFGTIHGPGYSGGDAYGDIQNIPGGVAGPFRDYTIEWEPNSITWSVDGTEYHTATPADLDGKPWVFNDPVFLLLNLAIGGSFGGALSPDLTFPQEMKVDYVRVYQGPDTAERFEAAFTDDFTGWQEVTIPFGDLTRSAAQPAGAPDDGLGLTEVWGYGLRTPNGATTSSVMLDQVRLVDSTPPTVVITDDVDDEVATGNVTFHLAFSEDVGTSFTKDDVVVTGGTAGAFTRVDGRHATLVARPPAGSTGTLEVSVAAGVFEDLAGNASTEAASAEQAYETPAPAGGGLVITHDEAGLNLIGFGGAEDSSVVADPTSALNKVLRVVKADGSQVWAGTIVGTEPDGRVPVIPFSESDKTIKVRVWSPDAGIPVRLKVETTDPAVNVETEATTTVAGAWETLEFDFGAPLGAPVDLAAEYNRVVIFFDFGTAGTGKTYYADDITFP
jgi:beta-glucanase (GH16 family)